MWLLSFFEYALYFFMGPSLCLSPFISGTRVGIHPSGDRALRASWSQLDLCRESWGVWCNILTVFGILPSTAWAWYLFYISSREGLRSRISLFNSFSLRLVFFWPYRHVLHSGFRLTVLVFCFFCSFGRISHFISLIYLFCGISCVILASAWFP